MTENRLPAEEGRKYEAAYKAHYGKKDIQKALSLYGDIIDAHPDTREAGYSRSQVQNIANTVVPKKIMMDSLLDLMRIHTAKNQPADAAPVSA